MSLVPECGTGSCCTRERERERSRWGTRVVMAADASSPATAQQAESRCNGPCQTNELKLQARASKSTRRTPRRNSGFFFAQNTSWWRPVHQHRSQAGCAKAVVFFVSRSPRSRIASGAPDTECCVWKAHALSNTQRERACLHRCCDGRSALKPSDTAA